MYIYIYIYVYIHINIDLVIKIYVVKPKTPFIQGRAICIFTYVHLKYIVTITKEYLNRRSLVEHFRGKQGKRDKEAMNSVMS